MTRNDAAFLALVGFFMLAIGATWLLGPIALMVAGVLLLAFAVVVVDIVPDREPEREE